MSKGGVHNELPRSPLASAMSRAVGDMVGDSGLERYGETLTPTLNLWNLPEWAYLRKEWLLTFNHTVSAIAGEFGMSALVVPAGSQNIVVVDEAVWQQTTAGYCELRFDTQAVIAATLAVLGRGISRDARLWAGGLPGQATIYAGTDPGAVGTLLQRSFAPSGGSNVGTFQCTWPIVLTAGYGLIMEWQTANTPVMFGWRYRERRTFPGELE